MPDLTILILPNDHTLPVSPDTLVPSSLVADNDLALGQIVEAISRSPFWPSTAVFVEEDDSQDGTDHVDGHRSPAFVISPWARRDGTVISTTYNQLDVLRTIGQILGLPRSGRSTPART